MDKKLQDLAWSVLPKEFKEEVKFWYKSEYVSDRGYQPTRVMERLVSLFGHHNLTSDAEGEEMLTCEKSNVQKVLDYCDTIDSISGNNNMRIRGHRILEILYGSKCLPDEEPPLKITAAEDCIAMAKKEMDIKEEPKPAEPEEDIVENHNLSQHCDKSSDNPQADKTKAGTNHFGDNNEMVNDRRLHIAAMAMAGLLANPEVSCFTETQSLDHMDYITYYALEYADKLIKKTSNTN